MATKRGNPDLTIAVVVAVVLLAAGAYIFEQPTTSSQLTGKAVDTVISQVLVQKFISIALSGNMSADGIDFGVVTTLPTVQQNGTLNYNTTNQTNYFIEVAQDSNYAVDFCIKADADLNTSGGSSIGLANETWSDRQTINNATLPDSFGASLTTSYVTGETNVAIGDKNYYRFWLNISAATTPGTYNNTVSFQGVPTGDPCT